MEIIHDSFTLTESGAPSYIAIGSFDGIHAGHRKLIAGTIEKARAQKGRALVFTFANHPLEIVKPDFRPQFLTTTAEKIEILQGTGIDALVLQPFTREFAAMSPEAFLTMLKEKLNAREIFVGFNFTFGNKGAGNVETLKELAPGLGLDVTVLPAFQIKRKTVSSTLIRNCIKEGKITEANDYLGYPFGVSGEVVHGEKIARDLGFPTANVLTTDKIVPLYGVYGGVAEIEYSGKKRPCLINVGPPRTAGSHSQVFEAHVLQYAGDLYGRSIRIGFLARLRDQKKFADTEELKTAIALDAENWSREYRLNYALQFGDDDTDTEQIILKLDKFEGPLDLLLELVSRKKLKISEIPLSQLIDEYLEVINRAKNQPGGKASAFLEEKSEFMVVAAELLDLKAKAVIDIVNYREEEKAWQTKLEEYAIFKELSEKLKGLENEYNISYSRTGGQKIKPRPMRDVNIGELQPLDLFRSYAAHMREQKEELIDIILESSYSIGEVAEALYEAIQIEHRTYDWIFDRAMDRMHLIYLFLSVLELYKDGYIALGVDGVDGTGRVWTALSAANEAQNV